MKYFIYLSIEQKEALANILEEAKDPIIEKFNDYIEQSEIEEYIEYLLDHLYREEFNKELKKTNNRHDTSNYTPYQLIDYKNRNREIAKTKANNALKRIKENINIMSPNIQLETLMDLVCHTNLDWMDTEKIYRKTQTLSKEEQKKISVKSSQSFSKKQVKHPAVMNTPKVLIDRDEDF